MDTLLLDLRHAIRSLGNRPGFSILAVLTLAIGIGVNTVAFSAINGLLFKPNRFPGAAELGWIMSSAPGNLHGSMSLPDFEDYRRMQRSFEFVAAEGRMALSMRTESGAEAIWALLVSSDYLAMLRAQPRLGRIFTAADLDELPVMVSERFWNQRLGGGSSIAGRTLTFNRRTFSIAGVLPDGFQGPGGLFEPAVWLPLERIDVLELSPELRSRGTAWLGMTGRLKRGVTYVEAEADLRSIARDLAAVYPATNKDRGVTFRPVIYGNAEVQSLAPLAWIALGAVAIVLLIACFNVAGLMLARAVERRREIAVRAALGASRARILRQLMTEGVLLAALGGIAAMAVALWSERLLAAFSLPSPIPQRLHMPIDARLVGFTASMAALAGLLPAVLPALQATRASLVGTLKLASSVAGTRPSRARNVFVVAQIAGSTLFLAAALLFVRSFVNTAAYHPGFDAARVLTVEVSPAAYGYDRTRARAYFETALERMATVPGVTHTALADRAPFFVGMPQTPEVSAGGEDCRVVKCRTAYRYSIGRGYFAALGLPIVAGRDFTDQDAHAGDAVIVGQALASQLWPAGPAVGQWLREGPQGVARQVVGVAADVKRASRLDRPGLSFYRPARAEDLDGRMTLLLRTAGDPATAIAAVRQHLVALDPEVPSYVRTMTERMEIQLWPSRTAAGFLLVCGTLAIVLAAVGLFGVTYYAVSQRTREFGIRVALGATPRRVMSLVVREGLTLTIPGVLIGTAAAFAAAGVASNALFGIGPADPVTYGATAVLQAMVAVAACAVPAFRATKADPIVALRQE